MNIPDYVSKSNAGQEKHDQPSQEGCIGNQFEQDKKDHRSAGCSPEAPVITEFFIVPVGYNQWSDDGSQYNEDPIRSDQEQGKWYPYDR